MTTRISPRFLKLAAALGVVGSAILFAGINLNPETQPPITVAPYAIKDFDLAPNGTKAYRPWYENGAWQGDLIEYDICYDDPDPACGDGQRRTDARIVRNRAILDRHVEVHAHQHALAPHVDVGDELLFEHIYLHAQKT